MLVRDVMTSEFVSLRPDDTVQNFISLMERHHIHEVPVIDEKGRLLGDVQYKKLATKGLTDPSAARIRVIMDSPPPTISPDDPVENAAGLIFRTGLRALPVLDGNKVVGIISAWDIVELAAGTKLFRQTPAENIMSAAEVINQDDDIGKARVVMRERGISRLPVVDSAGKLAGIITVFDLLRAVKPHERQGWFSMAAEVDRIMGCPVSTVMNSDPPTAERRTSLSDIAALMVERKTSGIIIADNRVPVGVLTTKDLLEVYIGSLQQKGVYYQVIGLTDEDDTIVATVDRMIRDTLQKVSSVIPIQYFFVHCKKHSLEGLRIKYSVRARLRTNAGTFMAKSVKWDARDAVGEALDHLERRLLRDKETMITKSQKNARKFKQLRQAQEL